MVSRFGRLPRPSRPVSVVTQGPPWWRKWLLTLHLYHTGALVSVPESEHATNFPG